MSHNRLTIEEVLSRFQSIHEKGHYSYPKFTTYISRKQKIPIHCNICDLDFPQTVNDHLEGRGCPFACKINKMKKAQSHLLLSVDIVKERTESNPKTKAKHIDWSKAVYVNSKTKMQLFCLDHDAPAEFWKEPSELMVGKTCPLCGNTRSNLGESFTKEFFINLANTKGGKALFYIIRGYNFEEDFFKFGITSNSLKTRFSKQGQLPYAKEKLLVVEGPAAIIWEIEHVFKMQVKPHKYLPLIAFSGSILECFSILPDMDKVLNHKLFDQVEVITNNLKEVKYENDKVACTA